MDRRRSLLASCVIAALVAASAAPRPLAASDTANAAPALDGREIMAQVDRRPRGPDQRLRMTWHLREASGRERIRETRSYWRDYRDADARLRSKRLIVFDSPPDVRETALLVWSYREPGVDDDRWIYLPALRKVRRVAGADRSRSFTGSEFNYDDLGDRELDEDTHVLLRSESEAGRELYVVESSARDPDSPYARRLQWIDASNFTVPRIEYYDAHDRLAKVLRIDWRDVGGVWDWARLVMENVRSGRSTEIEVSEIAHGLGLPDDAFSESALRFGVP
jgi:outer membrane lipoprotein-sorting protein